MLLGRVADYATLEPEKLATHVAVWDGRRAGNAYEAFCLEHRGKDIIKREAYEIAMMIAESARKAGGKMLTGGAAQIVLQWTDAETGLALKGRLDYLSRGYGVLDLKTTADASALAFGRRAASLQYPVQAAMYTDGAEANGYGVLPYTILAVESRAPFAATTYVVTPDHLDQGRETYRGWLQTVKECQERGEWPAYPPGVLSLPKWAQPDDNDITGLGLDFGDQE
jgi:hypothetical protein